MSKKLKLWGLMFVVLLITTMFLSSNVRAAETVISDSKKTMYVGETYTLSLKNASGKVEWQTSNKKIATVDGNGKVKALKKGKVQITAKAQSKEYECTVTVKKVSLSNKEISLKENEEFELTLKGSTIKNAVSSDKTVAEVSKNGTVKAISSGNTVITITGANGKRYKCKVEVTSAETTGISASYQKLITYLKSESYNSKSNEYVMQLPFEDSLYRIAYCEEKSEIRFGFLYKDGYVIMEITIDLNDPSKANINILTLFSEMMCSAKKTILVKEYDKTATINFSYSSIVGKSEEETNAFLSNAVALTLDIIQDMLDYGPELSLTDLGFNYN